MIDNAGVTLNIINTITENSNNKMQNPSRESIVPVSGPIDFSSLFVSKRIGHRRTPSLPDTFEQTVLKTDPRNKVINDAITEEITELNLEEQAILLEQAREDPTYLRYSCVMCHDKGFQIKSCLNCRLDYEESEPQNVLFGPVKVDSFDPSLPISNGELEFEPPEHITPRFQPTLGDLADLGSVPNLNFSREDVRLSEIINEYMSRPPPVKKPNAFERATFVTAKALKAMKQQLMPRRNPYLKLNHVELCTVLQDLYLETLESDATAVEDPYECNLKILRETREFGKLKDKFKRNLVLQSLRLRVIEDRRRYMIVTYVEAAFKKLNMPEFEPQGLFDGFKVSHDVQVPEELNDRLDRVSETLEAAMASFDEAMSDVSGASKQATELMKFLPHVLVFLFVAFMCSQGNRKVWGPMLIACSMWTSWSYSVEIRDQIQTYVANLSDPTVEVIFEAQANNENPIVGLALLLTSLCTIGEAPKGKAGTSFLRGIGEIPKLTDGLTCITAFLIDLIVKCVNEIKIIVQGGNVDEWIVKTQPEIDAWCARVKSIATELHEGSLALTLTNRDRARALELQGARLAAVSFPGVEGIRVKNALASYGRLLKKVVDTFEGISPKKQAVRQEPYVITFAGAPGVGKSWIVGMIIADVLSKVLPKEDLDEFEKNESQFMYNRFFEEEYFTNYCNEFVTVIDDFMQSRDVLGQPAEPLEFIRMVNSAPYTLHMADLASKGKVHFNSKIIVVNTNQKSFEVNSLVSKEALIRRMDCVIHVCPRREYCTEATRDAQDPWDRVFDKDHPHLKVDGVQKFSEDVYELIRVRYPNMRKHPDQFHEVGRYNYTELVDIICSEFNAKEKVADVFMDDMKSRIYGAVAKRRGFEPEADVPRRAISDLTMEDLAEEVDGPSLVRVREVFPDHKPLWIIGDMPSLVHYIAETYPIVWRSFSKSAPEEYCVGRVTAGEFQQFAGLVLRICANPERKHTLMIGVFDWYIGDDLRDEPNWRQKVVVYFNDVRVLVAMKLEKYPILRAILKITGVLAVAAALVYGMSRAFRGIEAPEFEIESHPKTRSGGNKGKGNREMRGVVRQGTATFIGEYNPEGGGDTNNFELCKKLVTKSLYALTRNGHKFGNVFVYRGRKVLVPYHYVSILKAMVEEGDITKDDELELTGFQNGVAMPIKVVDVLRAKQTQALADKDLAVFLLPTHFHSHPDLLPHFISRSILQKKLDYDCTLVVPDKLFLYRERMHVNFFESKGVANDNLSYTVDEVFTYKCKTERGDCGSVLTIDDHSVTTKILGFHVAGTRTTGMGLATALCREDFDDVEKAFLAVGHRDFPAPAEVIENEPQADAAPAPGVFHPYFTLEKRIYGATETKIRKSMMYGTLATVLTQPAPLRPFKFNGVYISPRTNAIQRYGAPCIGKCTPESISLCTDSLFSHILSSSNMMVRNAPRNYDFETAVLGQPGVKFCDSIPRNTSAGYPYVTNPVPGYHHKEWYFGKAEEYDLTRPACLELKRDALRTIDNAKIGRRGFHPYVDTLKDETISHAKAEIGKTRLVSACPLLLTVVTRMLFMDYSMFIMENRINCYAGVGMNPYSEEWHILALRLQSKGKKVIAGDFSGYDSRQLSAILTAICDMINRWYDDGEENQLARMTVFQEVVNSIHISGDTVYQWSSKLPSGHPLTTILNSMQAVILLLLCWIDLNPDGELGLERFWDHVYPMTYGDDNIFNISDECSTWYNLQTITASMLKWNQVYTDESKNLDSVHPYKTLEECTFLKRGFRYDDRLRRFVAPLAIDSILDMLNWYSESPERFNTQITNVENALKELSLHDRETFDLWSEKIIRSAREKLGFVPPITNYVVLQNIVVMKELAW